MDFCFQSPLILRIPSHVQNPDKGGPSFVLMAQHRSLSLSLPLFSHSLSPLSLSLSPPFCLPREARPCLGFICFRAAADATEQMILRIGKMRIRTARGREIAIFLGLNLEFVLLHFPQLNYRCHSRPSRMPAYWPLMAILPLPHQVICLCSALSKCQHSNKILNKTGSTRERVMQCIILTPSSPSLTI